MRKNFTDEKKTPRLNFQHRMCESIGYNCHLTQYQ